MDGSNGTGGTLASGVAATAVSEAQSQTQNGEHPDDGGFKLKFCTVCASNQNR
jgi:RNA polymerase II subunit A C-terminal domain phosphatase SSU72